MTDTENRQPPAAPAGEEPPAVPGRPPGIGQRIAFSVALLFDLCALVCLALIPIWIGDLGSEHPVIASLGASVVFFVGAGIVLHVIARARLPDLRVGGDDA